MMLKLLEHKKQAGTSAMIDQGLNQHIKTKNYIYISVKHWYSFQSLREVIAQSCSTLQLDLWTVTMIVE